MCYRYYIDKFFSYKLEDMVKDEGIAPAAASHGAIYPPEAASGTGPAKDVFPSDAATVICGTGNGLAVTQMRWGFANPYRKGLIANARAETAREKNIFSDSVMKRRIVIPASGFYEWDPYKARFRFTMPGDGLVLLAGFYREENGEPRFTIITTDANDSMRPVHDRMPLMIGRNEIRPWITEDERLTEFLERPQFPLLREQDSGQIRMDFGTEV